MMNCFVTSLRWSAVETKSHRKITFKAFASKIAFRMLNAHGATRATVLLQKQIHHLCFFTFLITRKLFSGKSAKGVSILSLMFREVKLISFNAEVNLGFLNPGRNRFFIILRKKSKKRI
jgi:hypothetical protein